MKFIKETHLGYRMRPNDREAVQSDISERSNVTQMFISVIVCLGFFALFVIWRRHPITGEGLQFFTCNRK